MSEHKAYLDWKRRTPDFEYDTYDRNHSIRYESGLEMTASSAPEFKGSADHPNPEDLLSAAVSSCHMLTFLAIAARSRLIVDSYRDEATTTLEKNEQGKYVITGVSLTPKVKFATPVPAERFEHFHRKAHENCFIANAVSCEISVNAVQVD